MGEKSARLSCYSCYSCYICYICYGEKSARLADAMDCAAELRHRQAVPITAVSVLPWLLSDGQWVVASMIGVGSGH